MHIKQTIHAIPVKFGFICSQVAEKPHICCSHEGRIFPGGCLSSPHISIGGVRLNLWVS